MSESGFQNIAEQLKDSYLRSLAEKRQALESAVAARNFKEIVLYGHQLKGSGSSYGFPEISEVGARIEEAGLGHQGTILESLIIELSRIMANLPQVQSSTVKS
jgi:histidine phosphotransfer protein HptB